MSKRTLWLVPVLALLVALPGPAAAKPTVKIHPVNLTIKLVAVDHSGSAGAPGYTEIDALAVSGTPGGLGGGIATVRYGEGATFSAKVRVFNVYGSIRVNLSGTYGLGATALTITGAGLVKGGTGRYSGATGSVTLSGGRSPSASVRVIVAKGKIRY